MCIGFVKVLFGWEVHIAGVWSCKFSAFLRALEKKNAAVFIPYS